MFPILIAESVGVMRDGKTVHEAVAEAGGSSGRFKRDFPLFVLTGPDTASAAELFAYALQSYGKARTVGQGTAGMAHLVGAKAINEYFVGRFSTYRHTNPVTHTDWEGEGVTPAPPWRWKTASTWRSGWLPSRKREDEG